MPPHVLLLAAVGVSLVAGYRMAYRAMKKRSPGAAPASAACEPRDLGALERDEATGEYRPRPH